jgi:hypothetical protein
MTESSTEGMASASQIGSPSNSENIAPLPACQTHPPATVQRVSDGWGEPVVERQTFEVQLAACHQRRAHKLPPIPLSLTW